jgi:hypothetical protein
MAELLLVANPKRRRKLSRKQIAAGFGGKRRRKHRKARKHVARRRRHVARAAAPRRRRRRPSGARPAMGYVVGKKRIRRLKLNPHRRHRYRRRHSNPSLRGITSAFMPTLKAGGWGAAGALANDAGYGLVSGLLVNNLPSVGQYLSNPYVGFFAKAFNAVIVGALGGKVLRGRGRELAVGAMTVVTHDFLKSLLVQMAPGMFGPGGTLALGSYLSGLGGSAPIVGTATVPQAYLPFSGMGSYLSGDSSGTTNSGQFTDDITGIDPWGGNAADRIGYSGY